MSIAMEVDRGQEPTWPAHFSEERESGLPCPPPPPASPLESLYHSLVVEYRLQLIACDGHGKEAEQCALDSQADGVHSAIGCDRGVIEGVVGAYSQLQVVELVVFPVASCNSTRVGLVVVEPGAYHQPEGCHWNYLRQIV